MGAPLAGSLDSASAIYGVLSTGALAASGQSTGVQVKGPFNVSIWGTFSGSVALERSHDGGTTWIPYSVPDGAGTAALGITIPLTTVLNEPETGMLWRVNFTRTSGTVNYRISQSSGYR